MENNIRALELISESDASIFIAEALRYYTREICREDSRIPLIGLLKERFRRIAQSYLDWESHELKRQIQTIDSQDLEDFRVLLSPDGSQDKGVDWGAIEDKAAKKFSERN